LFYTAETSGADANPQENRLDHQLEELIQWRAETLYIKAIDLYKAKRYREAVDQFKQLAKVSPDYKKTQHYLRKILNKINRIQGRKMSPVSKDKNQNCAALGAMQRRDHFRQEIKDLEEEMSRLRRLKKAIEDKVE
jgi:tetratricopeptide (TPR) repeat protein